MLVTKERATVLQKLHQVGMELEAERILVEHHNREITKLEARKAKLIIELRETA